MTCWVFNPLPWERSISGVVPGYVASPRGLPEDTTAGRHHQDRDSQDGIVLPPTKVPAFGYAVVERDKLVSMNGTSHERSIVENHRYRVEYDREKGGIVSLYDKALDWELVNSNSHHRFNGYVHEQVANQENEWPRSLLSVQHWKADAAEIPNGWQSGWHAQRQTPSQVLTHCVTVIPLGIVVEQELVAPGIEGTLHQRVTLPTEGEYVECEAWWRMTSTIHPEATYLLFPFDIPNATARYDVGGQAVVAGEEQLPAVCRDYFTTQGWVDFSNDERGVTIATPDNPMVQFGDFHFGDYQMAFNLEEATLLGWVTNNYWETNFRAHQPGMVRARYRIHPHQGGFDEVEAHRVGMEAFHSTPMFQHMGEVPNEPTALPTTGTLLELPQAPIVTLHAKRSIDGQSMILRLLNASESTQTARVDSALLKIKAAGICDLLEQETETLSVAQGRVEFEIEARRVAVVKLRLD